MSIISSMSKFPVDGQHANTLPFPEVSRNENPGLKPTACYCQLRRICLARASAQAANSALPCFLYRSDKVSSTLATLECLLPWFVSSIDRARFSDCSASAYCASSIYIKARLLRALATAVWFCPYTFSLMPRARFANGSASANLPCPLYRSITFSSTLATSA